MQKVSILPHAKTNTLGFIQLTQFIVYVHVIRFPDTIAIDCVPYTMHANQLFARHTSARG